MAKLGCKRRNIEIGDRFGCWTIISDYPTLIGDNYSKKRSLCLCDCGTERVVKWELLVTGFSKSCGCGKWKDGHVSVIPLSKNDRLMRIFGRMKGRCYNKNNPSYSYYGERGIVIFREWLDYSHSFYDYCMTLDGWDNAALSIDRIDPNGNYEPGNIRFATNTVQANNKRLSKRNKTGYNGVTFSGKKIAVHVIVERKSTSLGLFTTMKDAVTARNEYIIENNLLSLGMYIQPYIEKFSKEIK